MFYCDKKDTKKDFRKCFGEDYLAYFHVAFWLNKILLVYFWSPLGKLTKYNE